MEGPGIDGARIRADEMRLAGKALPQGFRIEAAAAEPARGVHEPNLLPFRNHRAVSLPQWRRR